MTDTSGMSLADLARVLSKALEDGSAGSIAALALENEAATRAGGASVQHYVLEGREPTAASPEAYVAWRKSVGWPCRIAASEIGASYVSTEFAGADLAHAPGGPPRLFQTVVFSEDQDFDGLVWTATTFAEAEELHMRVTVALKDGHGAVAALLEEFPA